MAAALLILLPVALVGFLGLIPVGGALVVMTDSWAAGLGVVLFLVVAWFWFEPMLLLLLLLGPIARSPNSQLISPETIALWKALFIVGIFIVWLARRFLLRQPIDLPRWIWGVLAVWTSLSLWTFVAAEDHALAVEYLMEVLAGVVFFVMVYHLNARWRWRFLKLNLLNVALISAMALLQYDIVMHGRFQSLARWVVEPRTVTYRQLYRHPMDDAMYRPSGTLLHPNQLGCFVVLNGLFALALLRGGRPFRRKRHALLGWGLLGLVAAALYVSNSRNGIMTFGIGGLFLAAHYGYRRLAAWGLGAALVVGMGIIVSGQYDRVREAALRYSRVEYGISGREDVWRNAWDMIQRRPLIGVGPGNFSQHYVDHYGYFIPNNIAEQMDQIGSMQTIGRNIIPMFHAHNLYLQLAAEAGLVAPFLFLALCGGLILRSERRAAVLPLGSPGRGLAIGLATAVVGLMAFGCFESQVIFIRGSLNVVAAAVLALGLRS